MDQGDGVKPASLGQLGTQDRSGRDADAVDAAERRWGRAWLLQQQGDQSSNAATEGMSCSQRQW